MRKIRIRAKCVKIGTSVMTDRLSGSFLKCHMIEDGLLLAGSNYKWLTSEVMMTFYETS